MGLAGASRILLDITSRYDTLRTMSERKIALLGYALLGLLHQKPSSGYDLRKIFATTPMGGFSDSPGAIYPALQRLQQSGLIRARVEDRAGLRRRRVFSLSAAGVAALEKWLAGPVTRNDLMRHIDDLMLRFAFMDGVKGQAASLEFLKNFRKDLSAYIPELHGHLNALREHMTVSGRLALESGILSYETLLHWIKTSIVTYQKIKR